MYRMVSICERYETLFGDDTIRTVTDDVQFKDDPEDDPIKVDTTINLSKTYLCT